MNLRASVNKGAQKKRLSGGGRHLADEELDKELAEWIAEQRAQNNKVTRSLITAEAKKRAEKAEKQTGIKVSIRV